MAAKSWPPIGQSQQGGCFQQARVAQGKPDLRLLPQSLQQRRIVRPCRRHGFQGVQGAEVTVPQFQKQRRVALMGNPLDGKAVGNPCGFYRGKMRNLSIQRISQLIDQVVLFFGGPFPRAVMANTPPQFGKLRAYLRNSGISVLPFILAHARFQSRWR